MDKKTIVKAVKAVVNKNTVLPILEDVFLNEDCIEICDLETYVSIPYHSGVRACVPSKMFLDVLDMMKEPHMEHQYAPKMKLDNEGKIVYLVEPVLGEDGETIKEGTPVYEQKKTFGIIVSEGKRVIKLDGDDPDNYPRWRHTTIEEMHHIGNLCDHHFEYLDTALRFTSHDDLRPAMTGVLVNDHVVATDAHRLYYKKLDEPFMENMLLPQKAIKILQVFGGGFWSVYKGEGVLLFNNGDGVLVETREIDARFPDYKCVIPEGEGVVTMIADPTLLKKEITNAIKFSNRSTNQVDFDLNGKAVISSCDVDFNFSYKNEFEAEYKGEMRIGFNGKFLNDILMEVPKDQAVTLEFWAPHKCAIINKEFLIMPLMPSTDY